MVNVKTKSASQPARLVLSSQNPMRLSDGVLKISVVAQNLINGPLTLEIYLADSMPPSERALETRVVLSEQQEIEVSFAPSTAFANKDTEIFLFIELRSHSADTLSPSSAKITTEVTKANASGSGGGYARSGGGNHGTTTDSVPMHVCPGC